MSVSRLIGFCFSFLLAFFLFAAISFVLVRPTLKEVRSEVKNEWQTFLRDVRDRNDLLPGLVEAVRGFEPGQGKLAEKLLEARLILKRSTDPDAIVRSVDEIEQYLMRIERLTQSNPDIVQYRPFAVYWDRVLKISRRISLTRTAYNSTGSQYNRLLAVFPQNLFTSIFGFVPINNYPVIRAIGED